MDNVFGFLDIGVDVGTPLDFMPARFGAWQASVGLHLLLLGDTPELVNSNEDFEVIGSFGLSLSF